MQGLPSDGQDFVSIRKKSLLYVDKTEYIHKIIQPKGNLFLSRPRRFGKSLLLGAMAEVLKGNRELFKGLWIDASGYDFKKHPVVKLTMTGKSDTKAELTETIVAELRKAAKFNGLDEIEGNSPGDMLKNLVDALKSLVNERVAVLIDEHDAPIQSQIHNVPQAIENSRILHYFYSALQTLADDDQLHLLFVTGVTTFAQASIFSGYINLSDLTMDPDFNGVCGFTLEEFDAYIAGYLPSILEWRKSEGLAESGVAVQDLREQILRHYGGYSWDGESRVLNPYSLVQFLDGKDFEPFWFNASEPTFLLELIRRRPQQYLRKGSPVLDENSLGPADVTPLWLTPLLFQTGCLTIERRVGEG
ncbi:MAG: AAA family ATPase, partial [Deltaproteobacteria bacterium]|nr:AAA family ATPase [Deltaproteobacteria bacterium]